MGTISLSDATAGTQIVASLINNNNTTLEGVINGGIDDANLESAKIITGSTHFTQDGAATNDVYRWTGSAWAADAIDSFFTMPGALLGIVEYDPTTVVTASTTSTTGVDVDATNLSLAVTVPSSGKIMVGFSFCGDASNGLRNTYFGLRESTTNIAYRRVVPSSATAIGIRATMFMYVSGISPGAHTYKAAIKTWNAAQTATVMYGTTASPTGSDPGPGQMVIWAVP